MFRQKSWYRHLKLFTCVPLGPGPTPSRSPKKDSSLYVFPDNKHIGWTTKPHLIGLALLSQGPPGPFLLITMSSNLLLYSVNFYLFCDIKIGGGKRTGPGFLGQSSLTSLSRWLPFLPSAQADRPRGDPEENKNLSFSFFFERFDFRSTGFPGAPG
jgi:hypothetical protein